MNEVQIKILIRIFLANKLGERFDDAWVDALKNVDNYAPFTALSEIITRLNTLQPAVFDLTGMMDAECADEHADFHAFNHFLSESLILTDDSPPKISPRGLDVFDELIRIERLYRRHDFSFYDRQVQSLDLDAEAIFSELKIAAEEKLINIYDAIPDKNEKNIPELPKNENSISHAHQSRVGLNGSFLTKTIKKLNTRNKKSFSESDQEIIHLLSDIQKIQALTLLSVPGEYGKSERYCQLAETVSGVTEKIALLSEGGAVEKLKAIVQMECPEEKNALEEYERQRVQYYTLSTEAIIKLPKRDAFNRQKKTEVQREAIALNISRLLGIRTTHASMITYDENPALFVRFENIKLLSEYADGIKSMSGIVGFGKEYLVASTIDPVGEGLIADQSVDDFGRALAYMYLCKDPDSVGAYNQNKALLHGRELFVFDQVVMESEFLDIDSSFSLSPSNLFYQGSRHTKGRNRSLIEDSSFEAKFNSMYTLIEKRDAINEMFQRLIKKHNNVIAILSESRTRLSPSKKKELSNVRELLGDAMLIQSKVNERISDIKTKVLPKVIGDVKPTKEQFKNVLLLEKLVNYPALYNKIARPYKYPYTAHHDPKIKHIQCLEGGRLSIQFNKKPDQRSLNFIKTRLLGYASSKENKWLNNPLILMNEELACLHDLLFYPEHEYLLREDEAYLCPEELEYLNVVYPETGQNSKVIEGVNDFIKQFDASASHQFKIDLMKRLLEFLQTLINGDEEIKPTSNTAFYLHVKRKVLFDIQQKILLMVSLKDTEGAEIEIKEKIKEAFSAAFKLDRLEAFIQVGLKALEKDRIYSANFNCYLEECIHAARDISSHELAKKKSGILAAQSDTAIDCLGTARCLERVLSVDLDEAALFEDRDDTQELALLDPRVILNQAMSLIYNVNNRSEDVVEKKEGVNREGQSVVSSVLIDFV